MKLKELITELNKVNIDSEILLASDEEFNSVFKEIKLAQSVRLTQDGNTIFILYGVTEVEENG